MRRADLVELCEDFLLERQLLRHILDDEIRLPAGIFKGPGVVDAFLYGFGFFPGQAAFLYKVLKPFIDLGLAGCDGFFRPAVARYVFPIQGVAEGDHGTLGPDADDSYIFYVVDFSVLFHSPSSLLFVI